MFDAMKDSVIRVLALGALGLGVAGCDRGPSVSLLNGLDQPVTLHLKSHSRARTTDVVLGPGRSKAFNGEDADGGAYSVTVGGCELAYRFPRIDNPLNHPWWIADAKGNKAPDYRYAFPISQVLKGDDRLYLAGRTTEAAAEQQHGFPLSPTSKTCPGG